MNDGKPDNIILEGVTGSRAYGLDHEGSDTDIKGIFVAPTKDIISLYKTKETYDNTNPDYCYHEVGKFIELALKGNPTIIEQLYLTDYTKLTPAGKLLVDNRNIFLSNEMVKSYAGYCFSQANKLNKNGYYDSGLKKRFSKHTRHLFRLLQQGEQLITTASLDVKVKNREELFAYGELSPSEVVDLFSEKIKYFYSLKSVLPDKPDKKKADEILIKIRYENL